MDYDVYVGAAGAGIVRLVAAAKSQARADVAVFEARVSYRDLDLNQELDANALLARLDRAAREICARTPAPATEAVDRAIEEINHPMLRAVCAARAAA